MPKNEYAVFGQRLRELKEEKNLTLKEIASVAGVSEGAVGLWVTGKRTPEKPTLQKLADLFGVSNDYLLGNSNIREKAENVELERINIKYLPVIGSVRAGNGGLAFEEYLGKAPAETSQINGGNYFWLKVKGDSMIGDGILENDLVLIREQKDVESGEIAVVILDSGEGKLKRIIKKENLLILQSANPSYPDQFFQGKEQDAIHIVGKMKGLKREII
jgi:repressor LexA